MGQSLSAIIAGGQMSRKQSMCPTDLLGTKCYSLSLASTFSTLTEVPQANIGIYCKEMPFSWSWMLNFLHVYFFLFSEA